MKELKFDLTLAAGALLCPNATEFFSKAYITEDVVDNFRTLPGIKYKTKLATTAFDNILKESTCDFVAGTQNLSTLDVDVSAVSALAELCRFTLEKSFISQSMSKGSGAEYAVQPFMDFYWNQLSSEIQAEIEVIRWQGDTAGAGAGYTGTNTYKKLANGYEKQLGATVGVNKVAPVAITSVNVIAEVSKVYNKMAETNPALVNRTQDLRLFVSPNVAAAYRMAVSAGNTLAFVTKNLELSFLDIKIVVAQGMTAGKMVLALKDDLVYAFDGEDDGKVLKAIDLSDSVAIPVLRTRVDLKVGFMITNPTQIVYYSA